MEVLDAPQSLCSSQDPPRLPILGTRSHDRPSWDTPEARRERDAREAAEDKRLYGEPRPKEY
jgi:hypothetical protein